MGTKKKKNFLRFVGEAKELGLEFCVEDGEAVLLIITLDSEISLLSKLVWLGWICIWAAGIELFEDFELLELFWDDEYSFSLIEFHLPI